MSSSVMNRFLDQLPGIVYGCDYNPEQWSREIWREDVVLMQQANVRLVSLGMFSWSVLEPADGEYNFDWLDEIIDLLSASNIMINLATPNASPPPWLTMAYPETLMVESDGTRVGVGSRGHFCPSSPIYRERSQRIARKLVSRYGDHPSVVMWHVGNEYHANCYCDLCSDRFRSWLQTKYGDLADLNSEWGTTVWSQRYSSWAEVHVPGRVRGSVNPARTLDFARFRSEIQRELFTAEKAIFRSATPNTPVTTNFFQYIDLNDYRRWSRDVDVVAFDSYPDPAKEDSAVRAAFQYDLMRSMGGGAPWMLMEQAANAVSQWPLNLVRQPGSMRAGSFHAVARGADAVMFFQWRASRFGQEKFHSAMLPHGGTDTRSWAAVQELGNELDRIGQVAGGRTDAKVALVWDWENWWAVEGPAHPIKDFSYIEVALSHYSQLWSRNIAVDIVDLSAELSAYNALIVPNQYMMTPAHQQAVEDFVHDGGHLLVSYFSGIVNGSDQVIENGYPGGLRRVIGAHIRELSPLPLGEHIRVTSSVFESPPTSSVTATRWQDDIALESGKALAVYSEGYLQGQPAIVDNTYGAGTAIYLASNFGPIALGKIMDIVLERAGATPVHAAPDGIEITERTNGNGTFLFFFNRSSTTPKIALESAGTDLLTGIDYVSGEHLELPRGGVAIVAVN